MSSVSTTLNNVAETAVPIKTILKKVVNLEDRLENKISRLPKGILSPSNRSCMLKLRKMALTFDHQLAFHTTHDQKSQIYGVAKKIIEDMVRCVDKTLKRPPISQLTTPVALPPEHTSHSKECSTVERPKQEPTENVAVDQHPNKVKEPSGTLKNSKGQNNLASCTKVERPKQDLTGNCALDQKQKKVEHQALMESAIPSLLELEPEVERPQQKRDKICARDPQLTIKAEKPMEQAIEKCQPVRQPIENRSCGRKPQIRPGKRDSYSRPAYRSQRQTLSSRPRPHEQRASERRTDRRTSPSRPRDNTRQPRINRTYRV